MTQSWLPLAATGPKETLAGAVGSVPRAVGGAARDATSTTAGQIADVLRQAGCVFADQEARLIVEAGADPHALAGRRAAGEPLELVLGHTTFAGLHLKVGPGVFIPRARSLAMARRAARLTPEAGTMVELCCGVGPLAAVVCAARPRARVWACDVDPNATSWARQNLPDGVGVATGDLFDALPGDIRAKCHVLAANAPYVPTGQLHLMPREARDYEPAHALTAGDDGLAVQRRLISQAPSWLAAGGWLLVETSRRQARKTAALMRQAGLWARIVHHPGRDATWVEGVQPPGASGEGSVA